VTLALVLVGAAIGAPLRFFTDRFIQSRHDSVFPWGTLAVNIAGSFVLGAVVGAGASTTVTALLGAGFCGALTTYSTFGYETYRLIQDRAILLASVNVVGSLVAGAGAASLGYAVGGAFAS
jgi:fluoride exporter